MGWSVTQALRIESWCRVALRSSDQRKTKTAAGLRAGARFPADRRPQDDQMTWVGLRAPLLCSGVAGRAIGNWNCCYFIMTIPDKLTVRVGSLAKPMARKLAQTEESPSQYVRRLIAEDTGARQPKMDGHVKVINRVNRLRKKSK